MTGPDVRDRVLAVLTAHPAVGVLLTGRQISELADAVLAVARPDPELELRAELARGTGSGWTGRRWAA